MCGQIHDDIFSGRKVACRSFGTYESRLWDDVFSEFEPLTSDDIILVNFGAWYPKYKISEPFVPYMQWEDSMAGVLHLMFSPISKQRQQCLQSSGQTAKAQISTAHGIGLSSPDRSSRKQSIDPAILKSKMLHTTALQNFRSTASPVSAP